MHPTIWEIPDPYNPNEKPLPDHTDSELAAMIEAWRNDLQNDSD
jgi:hypothetical protein